MPSTRGLDRAEGSAASQRLETGHLHEAPARLHAWFDMGEKSWASKALRPGGLGHPTPAATLNRIHAHSALVLRAPGISPLMGGTMDSSQLRTGQADR